MAFKDNIGMTEELHAELIDVAPTVVVQRAWLEALVHRLESFDLIFDRFQLVEEIKQLLK